MSVSPLQDQLQSALGLAYTIERELGGGGMSRVFVARDVVLGRDIVVKALPPEMAASVNVERFRREIQVAAQLQHPHIVPVLSAGANDDLLYYTMPLIAGASLRERLERGPALTSSEAIGIWREVLDALAYAHSRGVVHRDIKPENILLANRHAMVTDFGIARAVAAATGEARMTATGLALGTPAYMAPEQAAGDRDVDDRADIYSAGLVAYEMLAGKSPFSGTTPREMITAQLMRDPAPIVPSDSDCPSVVRALVMRCLAKDPAKRPVSAEAILSELASLGTPVPGSVAGHTPPRRKRWLIGLAAAALVLVGGGVWASRAGKLTFGTPSKPASDSLRLVVLVAENKFEPAEATVAKGFADAVMSELANDPWINPITPTAFARGAEIFGFGASSLTRDTIIMLSKRIRVSAYLTLGVSRAANGYFFTAEVTGARADNSVGSASAAANTPADIPAAMHRVAAELRSRLVAERRKLPFTDAIFIADQVSPQAMQFFLEAMSAFDRRDWVGAASRIRQAIAVDSNFVHAWISLAASLSNSGGAPHERIMALEHAYELRGNLRSPLVRALAAGDYFRAIGQNERAVQAYDSVTKVTRVPLSNNAGLSYDALRQYETAERIYRGYVDTTYQRFSVANSNLVRTLLYENKVDEARAELGRMERADSLNPTTTQARYYVYSGTRDWEAFDRLSTTRLQRAKTPAERVRALQIGVVDAGVRGQVARQDSLEQQNAEAYRTEGLRNGMLMTALERALVHAKLLDDTSGARRITDSALVATPWSSFQVMDRPYGTMISVFAAIGDGGKASEYASAWSRDVPAKWKMADSLSVLWARGEAALAAHDPATALRLFHFADTRGCVACFYPRYARTFDALKMNDSSLVWYEKYASSTQTSPINNDMTELARAYRRLGELYEARGDWKRATQRYQDFVNLWAHADPALQPAVRDVKARIERLRSKSG